MLVLLGIGIGWGLYGNTPSPLSFTSDPGRQARRHRARGAHAAAAVAVTGRLTGLFEQMKQKFGDTMGYRLVIYPDYASLDRPDPNEERRAAELHLPRRLG